MVFLYLTKVLIQAVHIVKQAGAGKSGTLRLLRGFVVFESADVADVQMPGKIVKIYPLGARRRQMEKRTAWRGVIFRRAASSSASARFSFQNSSLSRESSDFSESTSISWRMVYSFFS